MTALLSYLQGLRAIHTTGEAVEETSYYGQLEKLFNDVGATLSPKVTCVLTTRNRGVGIPDGGLFIARDAVKQAGESALLARAPERGVMEVKGSGQNARAVASSKQVSKYLNRYGKVLVSTYREFLVVGLGPDGKAVEQERFTLARDESSFWALHPKQTDDDRGGEFEAFLARALLGDAPLAAPADLAWFLAAYARTALKRIEDAGEMETLATLRKALEDALGLKFEGKDGEHFFRSALIQTLFYGVFAAWVFWAEGQPEGSKERFTWKQAQWTLGVPMVSALYEQLATPNKLPVGMDEVLNWTDDVLARVDRKLFFKRFEAAEAVQYFYEPFLQAYDPELRQEMGVWYTPPAVVHYIVEKIDAALRDELGLPLGLADDRVHVLDPCTGTGSFATAVIARIARTLKEQGGNGLVASEVKDAVLTRIHGFELLPAPFVIAHLQVGLALQRLGAPLDAGAGERAGVYLTNSLTGWMDSQDAPKLPFPEFTQERDAAEAVKREEPILVVLGNPPYNGFAGVSGDEEGGLVEPYKKGLNADWDVTKNMLDDLYIRFFRVAERRIAEQTRKGIISFISSFSWLASPSAVVMRERLLTEFDSITIDSLNGDSRETGKKTPGGAPDPSVFTTKLNPAGIKLGTAVSLLVRTDDHHRKKTRVRYRDFWGQDKREQLEAAIKNPDASPDYEELFPDKANWYRLRRWSPRQGYDRWPSVAELCAEDPMLGLNENRAEGLSHFDRDILVERMRTYLDPKGNLADVDARLQRNWAAFKPAKVREKLLEKSPFDEDKVVRFQVRPFDLRYAYVDTTPGLWNRSRPLLVRAAEASSSFLLVRRQAPKSLDGCAVLFSRCLVDQHALSNDAYVIPFVLADDRGEDGDRPERLFGNEERAEKAEWLPNLSRPALDYLAKLGIDDTHAERDSASLIWWHVLATGFTPLYLEENSDSIRANWPRIPLPSTEPQLRDSAGRGREIAGLLDLDVRLAGVDKGTIKDRLRTVAAVLRTDGVAVTPKTDLAVTAGYGTRQRTGAVFPGSGRVVERDRTDSEREVLSDEQLELLGEQVLDVYLNEKVMWQGVPQAVWDYKIGGSQVLRKWLSYREKKVLGRDLTRDEAREFTNIARRLAEIALLGPALDGNYVAVTESPHQEKLFAGT